VVLLFPTIVLFGPPFSGPAFSVHPTQRQPKVIRWSRDTAKAQLPLKTIKGERCKLASGVWGEAPANIDFGVF